MRVSPTLLGAMQLLPTWASKMVLSQDPSGADFTWYTINLRPSRCPADHGPSAWLSSS